MIKELFDREPAFYMTMGFALIVFLVFGIQYLSSSEDSIKITFDTSDTSNKSSYDFDSNRDQIIVTGEEDPSLRLSYRYFEANAIISGLLHYCLHSYFTKDQKIPVDNITLLNKFKDSDLFPPFIRKIDENGQITSLQGTYYVKYRAQPFMIAVLSSGINYREDGSVFVMRVPDKTAGEFFSNDKNRKIVQLASVYIAPDKADAQVPKDLLSDPNSFFSLNWRVEPFSSRTFCGPLSYAAFPLAA